ncbi:TIGR01777 family oxidoreductase [Robertmurraya sp. FSL W8-0741]|uniref:TIGR01777 family oxidoreductase n=1 Tax=Robertmurraya sp. FSL W8-0741 TaxID=2954629 RepID=UPI0030F4D94A
MRIAIAGGSGFVGNALTKRLIEQGHEVFILTRSPAKNGDIKYIQWLTEGSDPAGQLKEIDVMMNLAGESIGAGRWTSTRKQLIVQSRLQTVAEVLQIMKQLPTKPKVFLNASAIGFYGTSLHDRYTEADASAGSDFLASTVKQWEEKALEATHLNVRTVLCRFGIILDKKEGALPRMALPYKLFAGGNLGTGQQWMSWIHLDDVVNGIIFAIENENLSGSVNFTAPVPVKMEQLGKSLAQATNRPHWFPTPAFMLKALLGEMSLLVLEGQHVLPTKLQQAGYQFQYKEIASALADIYEN